MRQERQVNSVTGFYGCYASKGSATRAMHNMVGRTLGVDFPGISNRFDACVQVRADMLAVTRLSGGWGISFTYTPADLSVGILGKDGRGTHVPYHTVAHWENACTPALPVGN